MAELPGASRGAPRRRAGIRMRITAAAASVVAVALLVGCGRLLADPAHRSLRRAGIVGRAGRGGLRRTGGSIGPRGPPGPRRRSVLAADRPRQRVGGRSQRCRRGSRCARGPGGQHPRPRRAGGRRFALRDRGGARGRRRDRRRRTQHGIRGRHPRDGGAAARHRRAPHRRDRRRHDVVRGRPGARAGGAHAARGRGGDVDGSAPPCRRPGHVGRAGTAGPHDERHARSSGRRPGGAAAIHLRRLARAAVAVGDAASVRGGGARAPRSHRCRRS